MSYKWDSSVHSFIVFNECKLDYSSEKNSLCATRDLGLTDFKTSEQKVCITLWMHRKMMYLSSVFYSLLLVTAPLMLGFCCFEVFFGLRDLFFLGHLALHLHDFCLLPSMITPTWVKTKHKIQKSKLQFLILIRFSQKINALGLSSHFVRVLKLTIFTCPRPLLLPFSCRGEVKTVYITAFFSNSKWCLKLQATCKSFFQISLNGCLVLSYHSSRTLSQCSVQGLQSIQCCVDMKIRLDAGSETSPGHTWFTWKPVK